MTSTHDPHDSVPGQTDDLLAHVLAEHHRPRLEIEHLHVHVTATAQYFLSTFGQFDTIDLPTVRWQPVG